MHYQPLTPEQKKDVLKTIGVSSFEELLKGIPSELRDPIINIPEALSEWEIQTQMRQLGSKNATSRDYLSFLGGGSYDHFIPAAVGEIISRSEFYTAYTPYQAEASQGTLQSIYEYQSLITELTGLDVSNASHYDGATSMAEAALLTIRHTDRTKILVARSVHPHYRQVLNTYLQNSPFTIQEFGYGPEDGLDRQALVPLLSDKVAGVIVQTPNFFWCD